jgi:hypothetical protein
VHVQNGSYTLNNITYQPEFTLCWRKHCNRLKGRESGGNYSRRIGECGKPWEKGHFIAAGRGIIILLEISQSSFYCSDKGSMKMKTVT